MQHILEALVSNICDRNLVPWKLLITRYSTWLHSWTDIFSGRVQWRVSTKPFQTALFLIWNWCRLYGLMCEPIYVRNDHLMVVISFLYFNKWPIDSELQICEFLLFRYIQFTPHVLNPLLNLKREVFAKSLFIEFELLWICIILDIGIYVYFKISHYPLSGLFTECWEMVWIIILRLNESDMSFSIHAQRNWSNKQKGINNILVFNYCFSKRTRV